MELELEDVKAKNADLNRLATKRGLLLAEKQKMLEEMGARMKRVETASSSERAKHVLVNREKDLLLSQLTLVVRQ